jgi:hypothetical protein
MAHLGQSEARFSRELNKVHGTLQLPPRAPSAYWLGGRENRLASPFQAENLRSAGCAHATPRLT